MNKSNFKLTSFSTSQVVRDKVFTKNNPIALILIFFIIGSFLGVLWESLYFKVMIDEFYFNSKLVFGYFDLMYGIIYIVLASIIVSTRYRPLNFIKMLIMIIFFISIILVITNLVRINYLDVAYYDFHNSILHYQNIISLEIWLSTLVFSILSFYIVFPFVTFFLEKIPYRFANICLVVIMILMSINISMSIYLNIQ